MNNNPVIRMDLPTGIVLIECFPHLAPNHVKQILEIANNGWYDGTVFHRVIEGFMAQGGWTRRQLPQLIAEFNDFPHVQGVCSMARTPDPNSASDQFFICFGDARFLDKQYTVWGRVMYGMEHVHSINRGEPPVEPTVIVKMREVDVTKL
jgi:peptidylprolyl isomerase